MTRDRALQHIRALGVVPIVRTSSAGEATRAAAAVRAAGGDVVEITLTVPGALRVIEELAGRGDTLVGAGTVLDAETARACIEAGASFIVSPVLHVPTVELCRRHGVAIIPGALTPTEVVTAWQAGADVVKVFPCGAVGGPAYLRSLKAPLPQIEVIPTDGVNAKNAAEYIRAGAAAVGIGADRFDQELVRVVREARAAGVS
jgi:2-dehydro-3-deoxyphosphogluconate aldolase/(4S)-4-hydroxy-2-oxoglutarate aldolase